MYLQLIFICFDIAKSSQTLINRGSLKFKRTMKEFGFFFQLETTSGQPLLFKYICTESAYHAYLLRFGSQILYCTKHANTNVYVC